jgi:hypothetical protein
VTSSAGSNEIASTFSGRKPFAGNLRPNAVMRTIPIFLILLSWASASVAQDLPRWFDPLTQVRSYLELTESQYNAILASNDAYNRLAAEKQQRVFAVQVEISEQTEKEPLDPAALGIRYAEIETRCRELKDDADRRRQAVLAMLTEVQRTKLAALEAALRLMPVITEAQSGNLLPSENPQPAFTGRGMGGSIGSILGGLGGISACVQPRLYGNLSRTTIPVFTPGPVQP